MGGGGGSPLSPSPSRPRDNERGPFRRVVFADESSALHGATGIGTGVSRQPALCPEDVVERTATGRATVGIRHHGRLPAHPAAELFPMLPDDELSALAEDIKLHGLREPVTLIAGGAGELAVLDGRNRLAACELAGIEPVTALYEGDDPIGFVVSANARRRHLTTGQLALVALEVERMYAKEAKQRQGTRTDLARANIVADLPQAMGKQAPRARELAGKVVGVSGRAVQQAKRIVAEAPDLGEKVWAGTLAIDRAERIVRDRRAVAHRVEEARQAAGQAGPRPRADIRLGDFREVLADLSDIDAIITDPPYGHEPLALLGDLAAWADKVLAPDGVLVERPTTHRLGLGASLCPWVTTLPGPGFMGRLGWVSASQAMGLLPAALRLTRSRRSRVPAPLAVPDCGHQGQGRRRRGQYLYDRG